MSYALAPSIAGLDISRFRSVRLPEGESVQDQPRNIEALKDNMRLEMSKTERRPAAAVQRHVQIVYRREAAILST